MQISPNVHDTAIALISGLMGSIIGALVGGYLSYKGAMDSAKAQISHLYKGEKEKREWEKKEQEKVALNAFYIETKENLESVKRWKSTHDYFRFGMEAWDLYKSAARSLEPALVEKLIKAYSEIRRHNTSVDFFIELLANAHERNVGMEKLSKQTSLEVGTGDVEIALKELHQELVNTLDVIRPVKLGNSR